MCGRFVWPQPLHKEIAAALELFGGDACMARLPMQEHARGQHEQFPTTEFLLKGGTRRSKPESGSQSGTDDARSFARFGGYARVCGPRPQGIRHQAKPSLPCRQFRVCIPPFSGGRSGDRVAGDAVSVGSRLTLARYRRDRLAHQPGECRLGAVERRNAHFRYPRGDVRLGEQRRRRVVEGHGGQRLPPVPRLRWQRAALQVLGYARIALRLACNCGRPPKCPRPDYCKQARSKASSTAKGSWPGGPSAKATACTAVTRCVTVIGDVEAKAFAEAPARAPITAPGPFVGHASR